ncbi:hypothetical protein OJAV_G00052030 [Oryzias javanicus]|uniref:Uncharacterized protein n=1 Tax=Oryzias javanicus TaxID=123683 RepID=A0A3S2Q6A3_ORYJA|nr:hypothetical protein OJAV_G00052030 [Oryzias javanicus]
MSFVKYTLSFSQIQSLTDLELNRTGREVSAAASEDERLVDFDSQARSTWRDIWESRSDGYAAFILKRRCAAGTKMHKLQQEESASPKESGQRPEIPACNSLHPSRIRCAGKSPEENHPSVADTCSKNTK